jgi:hypothetical protein
VARAGLASARQPAYALVLNGVHMEGEEMVALATGSRTGYAGVNAKTGRLNWLIPVTIDNTRGLFASPPVVSDGVMYMVQETKLVAVPLGN